MSRKYFFPSSSKYSLNSCPIYRIYLDDLLIKTTLSITTADYKIDGNLFKQQPLTMGTQTKKFLIKIKK